MTLFGPDLSRYQQGIDIARIAAEGHSFVIAKVSQGVTSRDPAWVAHRDGTRQAGMLLAGYHMVTGDDPMKQAANCRAALGDVSIPLALDWEESGGSGNWANFVAVLNAFRVVGLNVRLAYCPRWYWQKQGSPDMSAIGLPLWSSRYVTTAGTPAAIYRSVTASQWQGYGGLPVALVQFTDRATIAGRTVDCSAFEGTRDQLAALLGAAPPRPTPTSGDDVAWSDPLPDLYPGAPKRTIDAGTQLAFANAHAAQAMDAANAANRNAAAALALCQQMAVTLAAIKAKVGA